MQAEGLAFLLEGLSFSLACHFAFLQRGGGTGLLPCPTRESRQSLPSGRTPRGQEIPITFDPIPKTCYWRRNFYGSDENKLQLRMSLELNQERQPKKKGLWQKLIEVAEKLIRKEEERKDPSDW